MAQFDPNLRREFWLLQKLGTDPSGRPYYRRMQMNLVEYDGVPDKFIEPINHSDVYDVLGEPDLLDARDDAGSVAGILTFESRPYEVHSFSDNIGE